MYSLPAQRNSCTFFYMYCVAVKLETLSLHRFLASRPPVRSLRRRLDSLTEKNMGPSLGKRERTEQKKKERERNRKIRPKTKRKPEIRETEMYIYTYMYMCVCIGRERERERERESERERARESERARAESKKERESDKEEHCDTRSSIADRRFTALRLVLGKPIWIHRRDRLHVLLYGVHDLDKLCVQT